LKVYWITVVGQQRDQGGIQMDRSVVVQYQTRPEAADENARLVADVYSALARVAPSGFRYATYRLADGVSFVHVATHPADDNPLATLPEFATFQHDIGSRVVAPPVAIEATIVGSYGL
jgi:hypothetical protein